MVEAAGAGDGKVTWADGKLSKSELEVVQNRGFISCVELMLDIVLVRPEVVEICHNGGFSVKELESIFKVCWPRESLRESRCVPGGGAEATKVGNGSFSFLSTHAHSHVDGRGIVWMCAVDSYLVLIFLVKGLECKKMSCDITLDQHGYCSRVPVAK